MRRAALIVGIVVAALVTSTLGVTASAGPAQAAADRSPFNRAYGTFTTFHRSGSGKATITLPSNARSGIMIAVSRREDVGFTVRERDTQHGILAVDTAANSPYSGVTGYGLDTWRRPTSLEVITEGPWSITFRQVSHAPLLPDKATGNGVYLYLGGAEDRTLTSRAHVQGIRVRETPLREDYETVVANPTSGSYSQERVHLQAGPSVVQVNTDGPWSIK